MHISEEKYVNEQVHPKAQARGSWGADVVIQPLLLEASHECFLLFVTAAPSEKDASSTSGWSAPSWKPGGRSGRKDGILGLSTDEGAEPAPNQTGRVAGCQGDSLPCG